MDYDYVEPGVRATCLEQEHTGHCSAVRVTLGHRGVGADGMCERVYCTPHCGHDMISGDSGDTRVLVPSPWARAEIFGERVGVFRKVLNSNLGGNRS